MTLLQLEYLLDIGETLSISKTAERKFVSQPAVSKQITLLEHELGTPLLDRHCKPLRFTPAGEVILESLRRCHTDFMRAWHEAASDAGILRLGYTSNININDVVIDLMRELKKLRPTTELSVEPLRGDDPPDDLDLYITYASSPLREGWEERQLFSSRCFFVFSRTDPLASKPSLSPSDFAGKTLFTGDSKRVDYHDHIEICRRFGFTPHTHHSRSVMSLVLSLVSENGFCIMDELCKETALENLALLPLDISVDVSIRYRKGAGENVMNCVELFSGILKAWFNSKRHFSA